MNNQNNRDLIHLYDEIGHNTHEILEDQLMSLPHPILSDEARSRMLQRVQLALPQTPISTMPTTIRYVKVRYPAQSALQLAASVAIFVVMLYQFGLPAIHDNESIETIYPIQRSAEMQDVELIAEYFS